MHEFEYESPGSLPDALTLAASADGAARYLAGGTDLFLALEKSPNPLRLVIDLKRIPGLDRIEARAGGGFRIGALTPMAEIAAHPEIRRSLPALAEGASFVGGPAIRNRATVGGNLCNASPAADTAPPLLACGATVEIAGPHGTRAIPLAELWVGPRRVTLAPGELVGAVIVPAPPPRSGTAFGRITRSAMDIALVNAAAVVTLDGQGRVGRAVLTLGAVAPTVVSVPDISRALEGRAPDEAAWREAAELARSAVKPIDDVRASAEYRRDMVGVLAARCLREAAARAARNGGARS